MRGESPSPVRFARQALLYAVSILLALLLALPWLGAGLSLAVKSAHALAGWPAPDLLLDIQPAIALPLSLVVVLALTAASDWIPVRARLLAALCGTIAMLCVLTAHATLSYSPYLARSTATWFLSTNLLLSGLTLQVVLWFACIGLPQSWLPKASSSETATQQSARTIQRSAAALVATAALSSAVLATGTWLSRDATRPLRATLAEAVARGDDEAAFRAGMRVLQSAPQDTNVIYLAARLAERTGRRDAFQVMLYEACYRSGLLAYYFEHFDTIPELPTPASP